MGADRLKMAANALLLALESCQGALEANPGWNFLGSETWEMKGLDST